MFKVKESDWDYGKIGKLLVINNERKNKKEYE